MAEAEVIFDGLKSKNEVYWNGLIAGYARKEDGHTVMQLFSEMKQGGFRPTHFTYSSIFAACASTGALEQGKWVHADMMKLGEPVIAFVGNTLLDMYGKAGSIKDAKKVFNRLVRKDIVSWNSMLTVYAHHGLGQEAVDLFEEMRAAGFQPNEITFLCVLNSCSHAGFLDKGFYYFDMMRKYKLKPDITHYVTIVDLLGRVGQLDRAERFIRAMPIVPTAAVWKALLGACRMHKKVFNRLVRKDIVSWNSMLTVYAHHGLGQEAVDLFEEMRAAGFQPNEITFLCVLNASSHAGFLDKGFYYFDMMRKYKLKPDITHYVTIVDLLGRAGQLDRAESFIRAMPIVPTAAVWKALLGACRMHKNTELGAYAAERVFELDPHDSGSHMILSNIYASAGRSSDAARVRKMMNESGVKKEPACSWVEIGNAVHVFVANDDSHLQTEEIRKMWNKLRDGITKIGYVPDTSHALWFVDQEERNERLQNHCEKLALSFAILNVPVGTPITIKKNIRVCGDCHAAFKFVSKLIDREIILRDTNRFHHFCGGSCSCNDYW
ncbi:hypothetical protein ACS0TY_004859 [Phlomoides rotata]